MKRNVEAFKKYYANATKEEVIEDMFLDCCNLQSKIDMVLDYIVKAKGKDVDYIYTLLTGCPIELKEAKEQFISIVGDKK